MFSVNYTEMIMSNIISSKSFKYALKHMLYIFIFMILLSAIAYVLLPFLITIFMNQYKDDISLMRIIIFAAIPYSMRSILYYYMHAIDKRKILLIIDLFSTIIYFVILFFILKHTSSFELIMFLKIGYYMLSILSTGFFAFHYSKKIKLFTYEN